MNIGAIKSNRSYQVNGTVVCPVALNINTSRARTTCYRPVIRKVAIDCQFRPVLLVTILCERLKGRLLHIPFMVVIVG